MIALNGRSLDDEMLYCHTHCDRKVCIAFSSSQRMHHFALSLRRQQRDGLIPASHYKAGTDELFFDSGSSITMVDASDPKNLCGRTFHEVLYDPEIHEIGVLAHLKSLQRRVCVPMQESAPEMEVDNYPLDDFLNEFSIIKN